MAIVVRSALELYYHNHPTHRYLGFVPDYSFIEQYIRVFLNRELDMARLEEHGEENDARRRELIGRIKEHNSEISAQLNIPAEQI